VEKGFSGDTRLIASFIKGWVALCFFRYLAHNYSIFSFPEAISKSKVHGRDYGLWIGLRGEKP
jgi:hypothetical protein